MNLEIRNRSAYKSAHVRISSSLVIKVYCILSKFKGGNPFKYYSCFSFI